MVGTPLVRSIRSVSAFENGAVVCIDSGIHDCEETDQACDTR
jgi:hypothetical protein